MSNNKFFTFCLLLASWFAGSSGVAVAALSQIPPSALPVVAETLGRAQPDYHVLRLAGESGDHTYQAHNAEHNLQATFGPDGVRIESQQGRKKPGDNISWNLEMLLVGYGYLDEERPVVRQGDAQVTHARIDYAYDGLTEWYVNSPVGLEHGFTLHRPPADQTSDKPVVLRLKTSGNLQPALLGDGRAVSFRDTSGASVIRYGGLYAFDSRGQKLPAIMVAEGRELSLQVDVSGASWPVTVDPLFSLEQKLTASDGQTSDLFGFSVDVDGEWMAVGARWAQVGSVVKAGAVYTFRRVGAQWSQFVPFFGSGILQGDPVFDANFGWDVAIREISSSGSPVLVVGAHVEDTTTSDVGAVYVYEFGLFCPYTDGTYNCWNRKARLIGSQASTGDQFGSSVDVDNNIIVVGARLDEIPAGTVDTGSAYVFKCDTILFSGSSYCSSWSEVVQLAPASGNASDYFGHDVSISADVIAVGAFLDDSNGLNAGAVYVYRYQQVGGGGLGPPIFNWVLDQKITEAALVGDRFGTAVAVSGNELVAGAPFADVGSVESGVARVFSWTLGTGWALTDTLTPLQTDNTTFDGANDDYFGKSVDFVTSSYPGPGDYILVGAYGNDDAGSRSGSAYLYQRSNSTWSQINKLTASDAAQDDYYGYAVALDASTLVIGAFFDDDNGSDSGSVYAYSGPAFTSLNLQLSTQSVNAAAPAISATATLTIGGIPAPDPLLSGHTVTLEVTDPANTVFTYNAVTDNTGLVNFASLNSYGEFTTPGSFSIKAKYAGVALIASTESPPQTVVSNSVAGYAVIIEGGVNAVGTPQELGIRKSTERIYQTLLNRGFTDSQIFYFGQSFPRTGVDALSTFANINQYLLSNVAGDGLLSLWEQATVSTDSSMALPASVHFFLIGHAGTGGVFYLNPDNGPGNTPETLGAGQIDGWLDVLEIDPGLQAWPRTVVIGAPYSGGFISGLSNTSNTPGRVIITSTATDRTAFTGPEEQDGVAAGSYLLGELMREWARGIDLRQSFQIASERTRIITRADDSVFTSQSQYVDNALQRPLLDDNSDAVGTDILSNASFGGVPADGSVAKAVFLGFGHTLAEEDFVVTAAKFLSDPVGPSIECLTVFADPATSTFTVALRVPGSVPIITGSSEQTGLPYIRYDMADLGVFTDGLRRFSVCPDFSQTGKYETWYWGEATGSGKNTISKRSVVYVDDSTGSNQPPGAVTLVSPENSLKGIGTIPSYLDWEPTTDPDGDAVRYSVIISTSANTDANGVLNQNLVLKAQELVSSQLFVGDVGLEDGTVYFWQAGGVDRFGRRTFGSVWGFVPTLPPQDVPPAALFYNLTGRVTGPDRIGGNPVGLQGVAIAWNQNDPEPLGAVISKDNGDYNYSIPSDISVSCGTGESGIKGDTNSSATFYVTNQSGVFTGCFNPDPFVLQSVTHDVSLNLLDTDSDGLPDKLEAEIGTDPLLDADKDGDGLSDYDEVCFDGDCSSYNPFDSGTGIGTDLDVNKADTDGDGFNDGFEVTTGNDPMNSSDAPEWGDVDDDGDVDVADVLLVTQFVLGTRTPDAAQTLRTDVAPLVTGIPAPDGYINAGDLLLIQRKALGLASF